MNDVVLVDCRGRTVFRRRVNPNRCDAVFVEAMRPGRALRVELGVVLTKGGRAVWVPNPDADPALFAAFRECLTAAGLSPMAWALDLTAVAAAPPVRRLEPVPLR